MSLGDVDKSVGLLGLRFLVVGVIPSAILIFFVLTLHWSGAPLKPPDNASLQKQISELDAKDGLLIILAILALSLLLEPLQLFMTRLLEGYWGQFHIGKLMSNAGKRIQKSRYNKLLSRVGKLGNPPAETSEEEMTARLAEVGAIKTYLDQSYPSYPPDPNHPSSFHNLNENRLLPTRLGNVLRAAEDTAGSRYGFDTIVVWPRLYPLISDRLQGILDDQRNQLDLSVRLCIIFIVCTISSLILLYGHGWWLAISAASFLLSWLSYQSAIHSAIAYGKSIKVAFDLYRFDLLNALHLPLPRDQKSEIEANKKLTKFFLLGTNPEWRYDNSVDGQPHSK